MSGLREAIASARRCLPEDPSLAVFIVRDYQEIRDWELSDLVWAMYREYSPPSEVEWLLNRLEERMDEQSTQEPPA